MCPAAYRTSCTANASGGLLSVTSDRKYPKSAAKTKVLGSVPKILFIPLPEFLKL